MSWVSELSGGGEPAPTPMPQQPVTQQIQQLRRQGGGGGDGGGRDGSGGDREPGGRYEVTLRRPQELLIEGTIIRANVPAPGPSLAEAVAALEALGGSYPAQPTYQLSQTPLDDAFIDYMALTTFLFDDTRLDGHISLYEWGRDLAESIGLISFRTFLQRNYPDLAGWAVSVDFGEVSIGSLHWFQTVGIAFGIMAASVGMLAEGPQALETWQTHIEPRIEIAREATDQYILIFREGAARYIDVDIVPASKPGGPNKPSGQRDPKGPRRPRPGSGPKGK